jgi:hypothetical protein
MSDVPALIIGLRRVGGTSLVHFLSLVSSHRTLEHEPFNAERELGHITRAYQQTGDARRLRADIAKALTPACNVKHCIETVPFEVTRVLIEVCVEMGYAIFLLTRRDESRRLMSLFLAQETGVWDGALARETYPDILDDVRLLQPFDLVDMARQRRSDAVALCRLLTMLRYGRIPHEWLVFEELYRGAEPIADQARRLAARLGIEIAADHPALAVLAAGEGRMSSDVLEKVPNISEVRALLAWPEWHEL